MTRCRSFPNRPLGEDALTLSVLKAAKELIENQEREIAELKHALNAKATDICG